LFLLGKFHSHQSGERWTREIALYSASFQPKIVRISSRAAARRIHQMMNPFVDLNPFDRESGGLNAITDTPKRQVEVDSADRTNSRLLRQG
jgi:hypothetical protein